MRRPGMFEEQHRSQCHQGRARKEVRSRRWRQKSDRKPFTKERSQRPPEDPGLHLKWNKIPRAAIWRLICVEAGYHLREVQQSGFEGGSLGEGGGHGWGRCGWTLNGSPPWSWQCVLLAQTGSTKNEAKMTSAVLTWATDWKLLPFSEIIKTVEEQVWRVGGWAENLELVILR